MRKALWSILTLASVLTSLADSRAGNASGGLTLTSTAFGAGQPIPKRYTCDGENVSPPLAWSGTPAGTKSFVLIVDDPDAPGGTFTHWIVFNLPPTTKSLPEGVKPSGLPAGAGEGVNGFGKADYGGPCPPSGRHRYVHQLFALDTLLSGLMRPKRSELNMGHVLARATLIGTYQR